MDLRTALRDDPVELICSAKACRCPATWALRWNNPKVHDADRRKVWLACDEHEVTLRDFLSLRGFYRDSVRPDDLDLNDG